MELIADPPPPRPEPGPWGSAIGGVGVTVHQGRLPSSFDSNVCLDAGISCPPPPLSRFQCSPLAFCLLSTGSQSIQGVRGCGGCIHPEHPQPSVACTHSDRRGRGRGLPGPVFGFFAIVFIILLVTCSEISTPGPPVRLSLDRGYPRPGGGGVRVGQKPKREGPLPRRAKLCARPQGWGAGVQQGAVARDPLPHQSLRVNEPDGVGGGGQVSSSSDPSTPREWWGTLHPPHPADRPAPIVLVYFQLCYEDYRWWWRSFFCPHSGRWGFPPPPPPPARMYYWHQGTAAISTFKKTTLENVLSGNLQL